MNPFLAILVLLSSCIVHGMQTNWANSGWDSSYEQECCSITGCTAGSSLTLYSLAKVASSICYYNLHVLGSCEVHPIMGCCCGTTVLLTSAIQGMAPFKNIDHSYLYYCFCGQQQAFKYD